MVILRVIKNIMNKTKKIVDIISLILSVIGIIYFIYKCYTESDNIILGLSELKEKWWILVFEIALMVINILTETWRWTIIDSERSGKKSFFYNIITVTESIALSLVSIAGVGEHIAKSRESNDIKNSFIASIVGSIIQTIIIITIGIICILILNINLISYYIKYILVSIIILSIVILFLIKKRKTKIFSIVNEFTINRIIKISVINIIRYIIFAYQMYIIQTLNIFNINITDIAYILIYYMIITIIPSTGLADIGIRGSVAITIIGNNQNTWCGIAAIIIWLLNRVIPAIIGFQSIIFSVIKSRRNHLESTIL